jgi:hypothetical protein
MGEEILAAASTLLLLPLRGRGTAERWRGLPPHGKRK